MSVVDIQISSDLAKMARSLDKLGGRVQREIAQGLNEGGDLVRTWARRSMQRQTGLARLDR